MGIDNKSAIVYTRMCAIGQQTCDCSMTCYVNVVGGELSSRNWKPSRHHCCTGHAGVQYNIFMYNMVGTCGTKMSGHGNREVRWIIFELVEFLYLYIFTYI